LPSATIRYFDLNLKDVEEEYNAPRLDMDLSTFATEVACSLIAAKCNVILAFSKSMLPLNYFMQNQQCMDQ